MNSRSFGRVCAQELYTLPKAIRTHREQFVSVGEVFLVGPIAKAALRQAMEAIAACCANGIRVFAACFTRRLQGDISMDGVGMARMASRETVNQGLAIVSRAIAWGVEHFPGGLPVRVARHPRRAVRRGKGDTVTGEGFG